MSLSEAARTCRNDPAYRLAVGVVCCGIAVIASMAIAGSFDGLRRIPAGAVALAVLVVVSEFVPLKLPRQRDDTSFSASTLFVVALLVLYGVGVAITAFVAAAAVHDLVRRQAPIKLAFNVAQFALALAAAGQVLELLSDLPAPLAAPPVTAADLPAITAAALTLFVLNHLLSAAVSCLASGASMRTRLSGADRAILLTEAVLLLYAPVIIVVADFGAWLVPPLALPFAALYLSAREANRRQHDAMHDALTGLPNRSLFQRRMSEELRRGRRVGVGPAILLLDLDRFKEINDALGHAQGDAVLRDVAARLPALVRDGDVVARLGGDEFGILIAEPRSMDEVLRLGARIRARLEEPVVISGIRVAAGASIGVGWGQNADAEDLMRRADVAMYAAKDSRTGVAAYDPADDPHSPARLKLLAELREGIPNGELVVYYQPKLTLMCDRVEGVEALVRWRHPEHGLLGPDRFVELAERSDLMDALTLTVLRSALAQVREWQDDGIELEVAVNVSAQSLLDRSLAETVVTLLAEADLPPRRLRLEITETTLMRDPARAAAVLDALARAGVRVSIDDFGTGHSSLALLQRLPIEEIKIDRSFVRDMATSGADAAIVRSTVDLAHNLGMSVVAEGVEDDVTLDLLRGLGCHAAQGFLLSRPVPAAELTEWLRARRPHLQAA